MKSCFPFDILITLDICFSVILSMHMYVCLCVCLCVLYGREKLGMERLSKLPKVNSRVATKT